jgi:hypothetical protein
MDIICKFCNKKYASYSSRSNHIKKFHNQESTICNTNVTLCNKNVTNCNNNDSSNYICKLCKENFNNRQTKWRHEKTCKQENKQEIELLKILLSEMNKKISKLEREKNKSNNKNINNGSINNGKIINNININAPGQELMTLTKDDIDTIFKANIKSVITYIEKTNFDKEKKYNHNFCTTNQNGKYLLHYDEESSSIKSTKKKYFYQEMISNAVFRIESSYNKYKSKFKKDKQEKIQDIITRLKEIKDYDFNNKILKSLLDELNLLSYNSRNIVLDTWNESEIPPSLDEKKVSDVSEYFLKYQPVVDTITKLQNSKSLSCDTDSDKVVKNMLFNRKSSSDSIIDV